LKRHRNANRPSRAWRACDRRYATPSDLEYVGNARIWGGIHYRSALEDAIVLGKKTMNQVLESTTSRGRST